MVFRLRNKSVAAVELFGRNGKEGPILMNVIIITFIIITQNKIKGC